MADQTKFVIYADWAMGSLFLLSVVFFMVVFALIGGSWAQKQYYDGNFNTPENQLSAILIVIGVTAVVGAIIVLTGYVETDDFIKKAYLRTSCGVVDTEAIKAHKPPTGNISPNSQNEEISGFALQRENNVMAGMSKISELNSYFRELASLAAIPLGLAFVFLIRFVYSSSVNRLMPILRRVATSAALVGGALLALLSSHSLVFSIVNAQVAILGSGMAYCYNDFAHLYQQVFFAVEAAGLLAIAAMIALPEGIRLNYKGD